MHFYEKSKTRLSKDFPVSSPGGDTNRPFQFQKRRQLLIGLHNETLSLVAMRICNKDRSPVGIDLRRSLNSGSNPTAG
jgi:hypothetical protein